MLDINASPRLHGLVGHDTDDLIPQMVLVSCADVTVGDEKQLGIPGGDNKICFVGIRSHFDRKPHPV